MTKSEKRQGKIVYIPPEKCWSNVKIEETPHGYRLYRDGEDRHFAIIPTSRVIAIEYKGE